MKINIVSLIMLTGGFLCIYGAVKDKNPVSVVQEVLTSGKPGNAKGFATKTTPGTPDNMTPVYPLPGSTKPLNDA